MPVSWGSQSWLPPSAAIFPNPIGLQPLAIGTGNFAPGAGPGVAIADYRSNKLAVYTSDGMGGFIAEGSSPYPTGSLPRALTIADLNGDGLADVAVANYFDGTVTVLLNSFATGPAMVSAASGAAMVAPDSLASIYGSGFGSATTAATTAPKTAASSTVSLTDSSGVVLPMTTSYTMATQINGLVPHETATGAGMFTVATPDGKPQKGPVTVATVAPALFSANQSGKGPALGYTENLDGGSDTPAVSSCTNGVCVTNQIDVSSGTITLALYATGIRNRAALSDVVVMVGSVPVPVLYAGQKNTMGLDVVIVALPASLAGSGTVYVQVNIGSAMSNPVTIQIK